MIVCTHNGVCIPLPVLKWAYSDAIEFVSEESFFFFVTSFSFIYSLLGGYGVCVEMEHAEESE